LGAEIPVIGEESFTMDNLDVVQRLRLIEALLKYLVTLVAGVIVLIASALIFLSARPYLGGLIAAGLVVVAWPLMGRALLKPTRHMLD
jgi:hypothetical protein